MTDFDRLDLARLGLTAAGAPRINAQPLQIPGRDKLVRTAEVMGPDEPGDRRVYLSVALLEQCLERARASGVQRCVLHGAGVRVKLFEKPNGDRYEVWELTGIGPVTEPIPAFMRTP